MAEEEDKDTGKAMDEEETGKVEVWEGAQAPFLRDTPLNLVAMCFRCSTRATTGTSLLE